jgi:predicted nucleotidyltransferase
MTLDEILRPPTDEEVAAALRSFAERVRLDYGARLKGLYLFGSRARGDHREESDADVAVILADGDWRFWDEKMRLVDLGHDMLVDFGAYIQAWPFPASAWNSPAGSRHQRLIESAKRDAQPITVQG